MPAVAREWSASSVRALPDDGNRYEVVDGELLVTPAPGYAHQVVVAELFDRLNRYLRGIAIARVLFSPADIELDPHTLVQPDIFVFPVSDDAPTRSWKDISCLLLAVEVLSPGTARYDRQLKRERYQRERVPEYWIVDIDARLIERWRPDDDRPEILAREITWQPAGAETPLVIDVTELLASALR